MQGDRASSPVEARTTVSQPSAHMDLRDLMDVQQGSQASFFVEKWNSAFLFRCKSVIRLPVELALGSGLFL